MINSLLNRGHTILEVAALSLARHPKRVSAVVMALLLGGGGGAFAVASLAPDASELPVRLVLETVQTASAIDIPSPLDLNLYRSEITRSSDTADTLLKRLGVYDARAASFLRTNPLTRQMLGRAGRSVTAEADNNQHLHQIERTLEFGRQWSVQTTGD